MASSLNRRAVVTGVALTLILTACGSSSSDTTAASTATTAAAATTSTSQPVASSAPATTTTIVLPDACPDGLATSQGVVIGVQDWVRIRMLPTTESEEIGRFDAGSSVTIFPDTLGYDGSDYWWVTTQVPATGGCGNVAANFLTDPSGRLDQQIPGLSFRAPTSSGTWTYADRTSLRDPIEGSLDGAFFTTYSVTVADGLLIDQLLADQLAEFTEFEYDYPADWSERRAHPRCRPRRATDPDRQPERRPGHQPVARRDRHDNRRSRHGCVCRRLRAAPVEDLAAFLDSVAFDRAPFLSAVEQ